jgi:hypothetical protein
VGAARIRHACAPEFMRIVLLSRFGRKKTPIASEWLTAWVISRPEEDDRDDSR